MKEQRVQRILDAMKESGIPQMIISDATAIFYLTGKWIHPGERLLALYLNINGNHKLVINELFPQNKDLGVELVWYNDMQDGVAILNEVLEHDKMIGIDKTWPARFLLRLQELGGAKGYVNGSPIVDGVRIVKDEEEQEKMRISSRINDEVMGELISMIGKGMSEKELSAAVRKLYDSHGCEDVSFSPITAFGKNGADPHHMTDDTKGKTGDSVVLDIGGMKDISRGSFRAPERNLQYRFGSKSTGNCGCKGWKPYVRRGFGSAQLYRRTGIWRILYPQNRTFDWSGRPRIWRCFFYERSNHPGGSMFFCGTGYLSSGRKLWCQNRRLGIDYGRWV